MQDQDMNSLIQQAKRIREVKDLAQSGKMIEAIKLYREVTNVGLKEAKDAVEALARGEPVQINSTFTTTENSDASNLKEVLRLAKSGNKIEAIKIFREVTGVGLKEAKDAVEAMMGNHSVSTNSTSAQNSTDQTQLIQEALRLAREGKKIEAIKVLRQATQMDLKEAKESVEALERGEQISFNLPSTTDAVSDEPLIKIQSTTASNTSPTPSGFGLGSSALPSTQEAVSPINSNMVGCIIGLVVLMFVIGFGAFGIYMFLGF